ncbi:oligosaccharide flippase family protein [Pectobacterium carotovorum]|uniref:oligosaccharide flippase family protein n=1 Tax=Pectobacterium carotovorum TaxID=554 RepID=UPI001E4E1691|nr:oligosaccharide flippase family protein [Pectobacterium carotovorum]UFT95778.1 oligosaccharide flippase family protein [Pectobacterium carotovorum]
MEKGRIKKEVFYLYLIQISNMLLPLLTFPYLARVLGSEFFGKLSYAQSISFIAVFIVDFGFNFSAARKIGVNIDNVKVVDKVYSNVQCAKTMIFLLVMIAGLIIDFFIPQTRIDSILFFFGLASSISSILTANWFFQGIGRNSTLAVLNLICRAGSLLFVFLLVSSENDIYWAAVIQLFPPVLAGLMIQYFLRKRNLVRVNIRLVSINRMKDEITESFHNFSASAFTLGFTYLNPIVVKFIFGDSALGQYAVADRLAAVLRQLYNPIVQGNFSYICSLFKKSEINAIRKRLLKIFLIFLVITSIAFLGNLILGKYIITLIFGHTYDITGLLTIMIVTQFVISMAIISVNLIIVPAGLSFYLKKGYFIGLLCHMSYLFFFTSYFGVHGVAIAVSITEFIITAIFTCMIIRRKVLMNTHFFSIEK